MDKYPARIQKLQVRDISESLGKLPPQATEIEETVLGALLIDKNAIVDIASILRVEHFYTEQHQEIYRTIIDLFSKGDKIDMMKVVHALRFAGRLELVGGAYKIAELTSKVSASGNIEAHARILVEIGIKRELIQLASTMHQEAYEDTSDAFKMVEQANLGLQNILDAAIATRAERTMKEIALSALSELQARQSGKHSGLDSGFPVLDQLLNGFHKTDLIIVGARPGMGKTAFAMQAGKNVAERGDPVGIFSLEMSSNQLVERLAIGDSEIDSDLVKKGALQPYEFDRYMESMGKLSNLPLYIDDTPFMTIVELRARAMRMKTKYGVKMIIVDYLQLIKGLNEFGQKMSRDQEIGVISRTLKGIAKELDIPIIALAQLSRGVETRGGLKKPGLSDLRESGSIEQDADVVMFLYRPEYYKITQDEDGNSTHGLCMVLVEKHRNGSTGEVDLKFVGKFTKFMPWISDGRSYNPHTERQKFADKHYKNPTEELPKGEEDDQPF
jgi:replicative DNA helicase